ncbi:calcium-binding protein [Mycolicibacterium agri]|uniref:Calcium-binding protein n=1 Tax=Mycolicibacterium agri TaxID=36811 RepID=A0A2A7MQE5_MYCAG|nr:excalibur calcium-binding domain-containing protein [Mycolicibacterium agri]PEG33551.1 calcium-binding protein [Mycolicibacterium agri]GFG52957.1 hypothetical protein MAGR_43980 [Mycolicibacterium agri]
MLIRAALVALALAAIGTLAPTVTATAAPYSNCSEAKANNDCDIPSDSPYYQAKLDRDQDGIGCEC